MLSQDVESAAEFIGARFSHRPKFGIVLGTGSGVLADKIKTEAVFDYGDIPSFPVSTALGHKGRLIYGTLDDRPVVAMDGRFHLYEGHSVDAATLAIRVMRAIGVEFLFITNASGGINPKFRSGEIMLIQSHIDLMCRISHHSSVNVASERPAMRTDTYDESMVEVAKRCARKNDFVIHDGVYGGLLGPNYETRAEYRMLRRIGADVAGMSTIPEVVVAAKLDMKILGLSVITNVAKPDVLTSTSGQEVIDAAETAAPRIYAIVREIVGQH